MNNGIKTLDDLAEINTKLAAPGALAHRLQRRTARNTLPPT